MRDDWASTFPTGMKMDPNRITVTTNCRNEISLRDMGFPSFQLLALPRPQLRLSGLHCESGSVVPLHLKTKLLCVEHSVVLPFLYKSQENLFSYGSGQGVPSQRVVSNSWDRIR